MKYRRQLMGSMMALAIFMGNYQSFDMEDFVPASRVNQYLNQVHMKSNSNEGKSDIKNKKITRKDRIKF
jgi:1,4-dihydroxy-2-naphthoate octaprenyltransferase